MIPLMLAQEALSPQDQDFQELIRLAEETSKPRSYFNDLLQWGPFYMGLHVTMLVAVVVALGFAWRGGRPVAVLLACLSPFIFGATAMWIRILGMASVNLHEFNVVEELSGTPRPFYLGILLSTVALIVAAVRRRHHTK